MYRETIRIRDGVYTEQVTIGAGKDGLTIVGENAGGVTIQAPATLGINGHSDHFASDVRANIAVENVLNVTIQNVVVDGNFAGDTTAGSNGDEISGIAFLHASGTVDNVEVENVSNDPSVVGRAICSVCSMATAFWSTRQRPAAIDHDQQFGGPRLPEDRILVWNSNVNVDTNDVEGIGATALTAQNAMQIGGSQGTIHDNIFGDVGYINPLSPPLSIRPPPDRLRADRCSDDRPQQLDWYGRSHGSYRRPRSVRCCARQPRHDLNNESERPWLASTRASWRTLLTPPKASTLTLTFRTAIHLSSTRRPRDLL